VKQAATTTAISPLSPSVFGQSVTFTATVTTNAPGSGIPTGTITFKDGSTILASNVALSAGVATFATSSLSTGNHSITAVYSGDANDTGSTSAARTQTVNKDVTSTTLTSSQNPATPSQTITFTATVFPATIIVTVNIFDGATQLGTAVLQGNTATYQTTLSLGSHNITAVYPGDTNDTGSTSAVLTQVVAKATTTTTLTSSRNPSTINQSVTFTATVAPATATGTVNFLDGGTTLASNVSLSAGVATFQTSSLTIGSHSITAVYSGDGSDIASTSAALTQVVKDLPPTNLTYTAVNAFYGTAQSIGVNMPSNTGGTIVTYSAPSRPAWLNLDPNTGYLTGTTPTTAQSATTFTLTGTNSGGSTSVSMRVTVGGTGTLTYPPGPVTTTNGLAMTAITPTVTFLADWSKVVVYPALPAGVTISSSNGAISGTPTVDCPSTVFTVTVSDSSGGAEAAATINLAVTTLSYPASPYSSGAGHAISSLSPTLTESVTATAWQMDPASPALPSGLTIAPSTGIISGTPSVASNWTTYTVDATTAGGIVKGTFQLQVPGFAAIATMKSPRIAHTATLLPSGLVLITGGMDASGLTPLSSAELYNPTTGTFATTGSMREARSGHTATLLHNGTQVLIAGGGSDIQAELYNLAAGTFSFTSNAMITDHFSAATSSIPYGGLSAIEVFNPNPAPNGTYSVLIVGGIHGGFPENDRELYNENTGLFLTTKSGILPTSSVYTGLFGQGVAMMPNGEVAVFGGVNDASFECTTSIEVYSPTSDTFTTASIPLPTALAFQTTIPLSSQNEALVLGGVTEFWDLTKVSVALHLFPDSSSIGSPSSITGVPASSDGTNAQAWAPTVYPGFGASFLITGGFNASVVASNSSYVYIPSANLLSDTITFANHMVTPRALHTATTLQNGNTLITGGTTNGSGEGVSSAEIYIAPTFGP
jgi:hypothetical protein